MSKQLQVVHETVNLRLKMRKSSVQNTFHIIANKLEVEIRWITAQQDWWTIIGANF